MNQNTRSRKRQNKRASVYYPSYWNVLSRSLLASVGGYAIATLFVISVGTLHSGHTETNIMMATQCSFLVMSAMVIWAFCASTVSKAWLLSLAIFIVLLAICGVNYVF